MTSIVSISTYVPKITLISYIFTIVAKINIVSFKIMKLCWEQNMSGWNTIYLPLNILRVKILLYR